MAECSSHVAAGFIGRSGHDELVTVGNADFQVLEKMKLKPINHVVFTRARESIHDDKSPVAYVFRGPVGGCTASHKPWR